MKKFLKFELVTNVTQQEIADSAVACADIQYREGWHDFHVKGNTDKFTSEEVAYHSGWLEGHIFADLIDKHYSNVFKTIMSKHMYNKKTLDYVSEQYKYLHQAANTAQEIEMLATESMNIDGQIYFQTLKYVMLQFDGLYDGYKSNSTVKMSKETFYLIPMQGDLEDIAVAFGSTESVIMEHLGKDCSGIVKLVNDTTRNLIVSHNTHNTYSLMLRVYKNYDLNWKVGSYQLNNMKFTSRPADLNSKDDYYVLSNNLIVLETSLAITNMEIYKNLKPNTIPKWLRANIANRISSNGEEWIKNFFFQNSGTHNNQWLVIDYNRYDVYRKLSEDGVYDQSVDGIVYLAEQLPILDKIFSIDMTHTLLIEGWVGTFNAPYFNETFVLTGRKQSGMPDYYHDYRYLLFNSLQKDVSTIKQMQSVIRYHDAGEMCNTIAPRCDLIGKKDHPFGGTDGKVIDYYSVMSAKNSSLINGPSHIKGISEPFSFSAFPGYSHEGIPETFEFDWVSI